MKIGDGFGSVLSVGNVGEKRLDKRIGRGRERRKNGGIEQIE